MNLLLAILLFFVLPIVVVFMIGFDVEIRDFLSAITERVRHPKQRFTYTPSAPMWNTRTEKRKITLNRVIDSPDPVYKRKVDDGPWEDITPEEWEEEVKEFDTEFETFHHWREAYDERNKPKSSD